MKKKSKWQAGSVILFALVLLLAIPFISMLEAQAFTDGYTTTDGNALRFEVKQKKASSSATVKYETVNWYLFKNRMDSDYADSDDWRKEAFMVTTTRVARTDPDSAGIFWDTMEMDAASFVSELEKLYSRSELINGVTMYASRTLQKVNGSGTKLGGPYYNYTDFSSAESWSDGTLWAVSQGYNIPIWIQLSSASFNVRFVEIDENGKQSDISQPESFTFSGATVDGENVGSEVIYGEKLSFSSASYTGKDYKYKGYQWTSMSGSSVTAGSPGSITVNNDYAPNGTLELTFYFEVQPEPTPPPFTTPVVTKTPTVTPTPTPEPTATPAPTSQPTESVYYDYMYTRYFTTDAGHWIGEIADSTTYTVVSETSATGGGAVCTNAYTKRENSYLVGTDSSGNQWYFIKDGTNATYVHPAKYNGYTVESAGVKYITELVFPSAITYGGTTYTVTHIGGGTAKYKTEQSEYTDTEDISYYISYGTYEYDYSKEGSSNSNYKSREYEYIYGVLGNGQIYSDAMNSTFYETTGAYDETWYFNCYYVYNTTLKKITIPSTVKEIENYAFYNCRALEAIEGGAGLTTIWPHAFEVAREAAPQLSSTWTVGSRTCYDYIYYNLDYSMTAVTGAMAAWQTSSRLSSEFVFPYLPALTKIYYQAFKNHYNMDNVDLSATVATIGQEAFMGCELENIRIPNAACSIYDAASTKEYYTTLGSKGQVENPTAIHTVPDSTALSYGLKYDGYYTLYCGYPVSYKPNGGTPEEGYEIYSKLNIQYFYPETEKVHGYANYKPYSHDQYSYYSAGYQYCSYLAPDGVLWRLDTLNTTASVVAAGTTFTELINVDDVAHYALDSAGNVWFSGQTLDLDVDSGGSWYTLYSDMCGWEKLTLPSGTVEVKYDTLGIFALDGSGIVWWCDPSWTSNQWVKLNPSGPYFVSFTVDTYQGSTTIENNCLMYGVDASGVVWRTYADSSLGFYLYSSLDAWDYSKYTSIKITVSDISYMNGSDGYLACLNAAGDLYLYNGSKSKSFTGYNFVDMEPLGVSTNAVKVKDASGNIYVAWAYRSSSGNLTGKLYKVASSGVDIKQAWCGVMNYTDWTDVGMNSGDSGTTYSEDRIYVWTTDGYLTACSTSTSWKPASVKFSQIEYIYENIYAIAEDGTLWSMGNNKYGQLGNLNHSGSFGYDYPSYNASRYLKQTGTGTYQSVYSDSDEYTVALGTDGSVYFAGNPDYCNIMDGNDPVNEFIPATDQEWPGSVVITRYIMGYDYDTEIAGTLFKRSGYGFTGWNTEADGTGTAYQPGDMVELSSALTLYAQWGAKSKQVIFHPNGGNGYMPAMTFSYATASVTVTGNTFTRSGYEFTGWNTEADGSGTSVADKATVTVAEDVLHLYAQWNKKNITYTLVYMTYPFGSQSNTAWKTKTLADAQMETVEGAPYNVSGTYTVGYSLNKPSTMSTTPTMDAITSSNTSTTAPSFDSWELYKQVGSNLVYRGREYIPGASITKLTQTSGDVFYLYPSWGGANASVLLPGVSCEGYDFLGWSESSTGTTKVYPVYGGESDEISVYTPIKNTTLYAIWKPKKKVIVLDGQGGDTREYLLKDYASGYDPLYYYSTYADLAEAFDLNGTALLKHYVETGKKEGRVAYDSTDTYKLKDYAAEFDPVFYYKTNSDVASVYGMTTDRLLDHWVNYGKSEGRYTSYGLNSEHTLIFDANAGTVYIPNREQYIFQGYYTQKDGAGVQVFDQNGKGLIVTNNTKNTFDDISTLYAHWIPDKAVIYDANGGTGTMTATLFENGATSAVLSKNAFTKTGYQFSYWCQTTASCSGADASGHKHWIDGATITGVTGKVTLYAQWEPNTYTISLDYNEGTKGTGDKSPYTVTYSLSNYCDISWGLPTRNGYTFKGFYTAASGGTQVYTATGLCANEGTYWNSSRWSYLGNVTLYAQWTPNNYPVTLDQQGATTPGTESVVAIFDAPMPSITPPAKQFTVTYDANGGSCIKTSDTSTYTFGGYFTEPKGKGDQYYTSTPSSHQNWNIASSATLYAYWPDGGVVLPKPEKSGYLFGGWSTDLDGSNIVGTAGDTYYPEANVKLYAIWTVNSFSLTLNGNGGTIGCAATKSLSVTYQSSANSSVASYIPERTGYTFTGYNTKADGKGITIYDEKGGNKGDGAYWKDDKWLYLGSLTVYAQWKANSNSVDFDVQLAAPSPSPSPTPMPTVTPVYDGDMPTIIPPTQDYTVTYDANGGSCVTTTDTAVYTFGGFFTGKNGTGTQYYKSDGTSARKWDLTEDTTLYAKWTSASVKLPTPTRTGYTFQGWYTQASGGTMVGKAGTTYTPTTNITLYAQWKANTYNVDFDVQIPNGTPSPTPMPTVTPTIDEDMPTITPPTRKYTVTYDANTGTCKTTSDTAVYTFGGFFTGVNGTGTQYYNADGTSARKWDIAQDTILYAMWTSKAVTLPTPTKLGHTFQGWYTAASGGTLVGNAGEMYTPTADITVYAQWELDTYQVEFDQQGGNPTPAPTVMPVYGEDMPAVAPPTRKYTVTYDANGGFSNISSEIVSYEFGGYFTGKNGTGTQYYNADGTSARRWDITMDTMLYAKWTSAYVRLPEPTRTGYTFQGWYTAASSGTLVGKSGTDYTPTADITLYAQWKPNTYNIEFDQQGGTPTPAPTVTPTYDADMPAVTPPTRKYMVTYDANGGNCSTSSDTAIYTFGGYFTQINGGGVKYYNANGTPTRRWDIAQNTTLYAKWTSASVKLPTPTRENYTFLGWFTQASEGTLVGSAEETYTPTEDITLYAQWKKNRKDIEKAEISIFSIDPAYIVNANLKEDPKLPTLEWREYGDTMLEISVNTVGCFDYAVLKAPWESQERVFYWDEGVYSEDSETWTKNENIVFWRSQLRYPEEEDKVRNYPGYNNQTYTITISFYIDDQVVIEYKVGLYMVSWLVWREEIHPSREGGSWDFNGDGIPDRWPFENGK